MSSSLNKNLKPFGMMSKLTLHVVKARGEWRLFHVTWHGRESASEA